jgi:hypothetical protein
MRDSIIQFNHPFTEHPELISLLNNIQNEDSSFYLTEFTPAPESKFNYSVYLITHSLVCAESALGD